MLINDYFGNDKRETTTQVGYHTWPVEWHQILMFGLCQTQPTILWRNFPSTEFRTKFSIFGICGLGQKSARYIQSF